MKRLIGITSIILSLAAPVSAQSPDIDVWEGIHADQQAQVLVVGYAIDQWLKTEDEFTEQQIETALVEGQRRLDTVVIQPCFKAWWALARSSYDMLALALLAKRAGDETVFQTAWTATGYLVILTQDAAKRVDCSGNVA